MGQKIDTSEEDMDLVNNDKNHVEVWKWIEEKKGIVSKIHTSLIKVIGHVLREDTCLVREVLEDKMVGKTHNG